VKVQAVDRAVHERAAVGGDQVGAYGLLSWSTQQIGDCLNVRRVRDWCQPASERSRHGMDDRGPGSRRRKRNVSCRTYCGLLQGLDVDPGELARGSFRRTVGSAAGIENARGATGTSLTTVAWSNEVMS
jgi:hypothetical protein